MADIIIGNETFYEVPILTARLFVAFARAIGRPELVRRAKSIKEPTDPVIPKAPSKDTYQVERTSFSGVPCIALHRPSGEVFRYSDDAESAVAFFRKNGFDLPQSVADQYADVRGRR